MSFALNIVISDVVAAGIIMMGVLEPANYKHLKILQNVTERFFEYQDLIVVIKIGNDLLIHTILYY